MKIKRENADGIRELEVTTHEDQFFISIFYGETKLGFHFSADEAKNIRQMIGGQMKKVKAAEVKKNQADCLHLRTAERKDSMTGEIKRTCQDCFEDL